MRNYAREITCNVSTSLTQIRNNTFTFGFPPHRLLNPKIVYACTTVLADWEKLDARSVKSAVTLLHRIAFNCKSPAMLYQVCPFNRRFQRTFLHSCVFTFNNEPQPPPPQPTCTYLIGKIRQQRNNQTNQQKNAQHASNEN